MLKNLLIVMVVLSYASNLAKAADLTQNDMDDINKIENYINSITTFKSNFLQTASTGERSGGILFLDRPGKMRVQYDEPSPILLVSDGSVNHKYLNYLVFLFPLSFVFGNLFINL